MQKMDQLIDSLIDAAANADQLRQANQADPKSADLLSGLADVSKKIHAVAEGLIECAPSEMINAGHIGVAMQAIGQQVHKFASNPEGHGLQFKDRFEMYGVLEMAFQQLRVQIGKGDDINAIRSCVVVVATMAAVGVISINNKNVKTYDGRAYGDTERSDTDDKK